MVFSNKREQKLLGKLHSHLKSGHILTLASGWYTRCAEEIIVNELFYAHVKRKTLLQRQLPIPIGFFIVELRCEKYALAHTCTLIIIVYALIHT